MARTLYQGILGEAFAILPEKIRIMHSEAKQAVGRADIFRGTTPLARLICAGAHVPDTGRDVTVETTFAPIDGGERWTRRFNGQAFQTDMLIDHDAPFPCLIEKFGPFVFRMRMNAHSLGVDLVPESVSLWGLKLPKSFRPEAVGLERVKDDRYHFEVIVHIPIAGEILRYAGWIEPTQ